MLRRHFLASAGLLLGACSPFRGRAYVAAGDSNTAGHQTITPYPVLLAASGVDVVNAGRRGWTIRDFYQHLGTVQRHRPATVSLMFGTNDSRLPHGSQEARVPLDRFRWFYADVIERLRPARIILLTPPAVLDVERAKFSHSSARLADYAAAVRELAGEHGAELLDVHAMATETVDGIHLTEESQRTVSWALMGVLEARYTQATSR